MASLISNSEALSEAERLVELLKTHSGSSADQNRAVRQLDKLRCTLHGGFDALLSHALPFQLLPALNILTDFGVFDAVPLDESIAINDLGAKTKLDEKILSRFLRIALTQGIFHESTPGVYAHTRASSVFRTDHAASFFRLGTIQFHNWWKVSDYLNTHTVQDAEDATRVPYVWAHGSEGTKNYFDTIEADQAVAAAWHEGMAMVEAMQPVGGMFPFSSLQPAVQAEPHRTFVVDVGGGRGNALETIMRECEGSYGAAMVLQDLAVVVDGTNPVRIDGVTCMPHNFYDAQPVKNAHIYYLRNVLHNHYKERSKNILSRIVDAMGPTSRVLIGEMVLPATAGPGSDPFPFFMDLNMFMEGGLERTADDWCELLQEVGLEIKMIWRHPDNPVQCTIEAWIKEGSKM